MTTCPHTPKYPDLMSVPTYEEAYSRCTLVDDVPEVAKQRALTAPDGQSTRIDRAYWNRCSAAEQAAIVAHERAHPCIGMQVDCEGCADKVGGYYMRVWGYAPETIAICYRGLRVARDLGMGNIADNAAAGAQVAERALAGRGLLGASGERIRTDLILAKRQASAPSAAPSTGSTAGTATTPVKPIASPAPTAPEPSGTATQTQPPTVPTSTEATTSTPATPGKPANAKDPGGPAFAPDATPDAASSAAGDVAGDVVASVLGEAARPHAGKVLIAAGVAAIVAVVLVVIVRRVSK